MTLPCPTLATYAEDGIMRKSALLLLTLIVTTAFTPLTAHAESSFTEYVVGVSARAYPIGGAALVQASHGSVFWGEKSSDSVWYGFFRATGKLQSSLTVNSAEASLEFFPVSFLGFESGADASHRSSNFSGINCGLLACQGSITRYFASINGILGNKSYYLGFGYRATRYRSTHGAPGGFYDEYSSVAGHEKTDTLMSFEAWPGIALSPQHRVGLFYSADRFTRSHQYDENFFVYASYRGAPHTLGLGIGMYQSSLQRREPTAYATYRYSWGESPNLF